MRASFRRATHADPFPSDEIARQAHDDAWRLGALPPRLRLLIHHQVVCLESTEAHPLSCMPCAPHMVFPALLVTCPSALVQLKHLRTEVVAFKLTGATALYVGALSVAT